MTSDAILSLAFLKVNLTRKKDYIDTFVPLVIECLKAFPSNSVHLKPIQDLLHKKFGLKLPLSCIKSIFIRLTKQNYLIKKDKVLYIDRNKASNYTAFSKHQQDCVIKYNALLKRFVDYCYSHHSITWTKQEAEAALLRYLNEYRLIGLTDSSLFDLPKINHSIKSVRFLVNSFIQHLISENAEELQFLEVVSQGNMIANAIYLPNPAKSLSKFRNTDVYFDTPFLICALGYAGEPRQAPCIELLNLLYDTGANLYCFTHTFGEIKSIFLACSEDIKKGTKPRPFGNVLDYFLDQKLNEADVEHIIATLNKDLLGLRIKIIDKPPYQEEYVIDEEEILNEISRKMQYRNERALNLDVDSVAAILRNRKLNYYFEIEDCRSIMVTDNIRLVETVNSIFSKTAPKGAIPPLVTDFTIANLLWLKKPLELPDLPRNRIIADCYAAVQPDENLVRKFLDEVSKLETKMTITEEDSFLLRYSTEAKQMLLSITLGDYQSLTASTVEEILGLLKQNILDGAEKELSCVNEKLVRQENHLRLMAKNLSDWIAYLFLAGICSILMYGGYLTYPGNKFIHGFGFIAWSLFIFFSLLGVLLGINLKGVSRKAKSLLYRAIYSKLVIK